MMIPIPRSGVYRRVDGVEDGERGAGRRGGADHGEARSAAAGAAGRGEYLGFIFARAATPAEAERAVREAHARLQFTIDPL